MPITIADVAARAKVSKTTVSRVLNGKGELDESTAARVRAVIDELGYVPSARAVNLARGRTRVIGMLVPSLTWPWMGEVVQGAVDVLEAEEYGLLLFTFNRGDDSMRQFAAQVAAKSFDGLLAIEPEGTLGYLTTLHTRGLPMVLIDDRDQIPVGQIPTVGTTNHSGAADAARHLLEIGRHKPLVITGPSRFGCTVQRNDGFVSTFAEAGRPIPETYVLPGDFTVACGADGVKQAIASGLDFDAVFCHNDLSAFGAVQAVLDAGRRVPEDVAVVGFDDIPMAAHHQPPLSTVHQPMREMGEAAARTLLAHFEGTTLPNRPTVIPATFTARASTQA
ncbi:LacI family DNA-binding transcriptional regulator [Actinoplanes regularis]|uniref:Transcriptional regulator, LacI family n=1 Tax=Actinoplanes regularis TaxID=52697 RepID=A0A239DF58_9ACTN|nr:LacI family DNA-binding transcriptional regulator [Actinoplanes regularis]GIE88791.1 LacI family transcriptional regulator [Actinoplanes regularis]GLW32624.1 LacI family transcriptional regulator [Actinoplanes regularis]SNS30702.1 transcriptional regulator, LacI family [Actinoplanes regularis]